MDILKLAREAQISNYEIHFPVALERFADLVIEECARVCDPEKTDHAGDAGCFRCGVENGHEQCAAALRALKSKP
jgi:hypothetical protein